MKTKLLIILFFLTPFLAKSQFTSDLVIFAPAGDSFRVQIKGFVNSNFSNKIRINDMQPGNYNIIIIFQNRGIPNINLNIYIQPNAEIACVIQKDNMGVYYTEMFEAINYLGNSNIIIIEPEHPFLGFCNYPMDDAAFAKALQAIKNENFDSNKMTVAKQIANTNCLLTEQVIEIMKLFSFESGKLEFAKHAYTRVYDPGNYFAINNEFSFSSSVDELSEYINSL